MIFRVSCVGRPGYEANTGADAGFVEGGLWYIITRKARTKVFEVTPTFD